VHSRRLVRSPVSRVAEPRYQRLKTRTIRQILSNPFRLIYRVEDERVLILAVLHQRQDVEHSRNGRACGRTYVTASCYVPYCWESDLVTKSSASKKQASRRGKVRKEFWLDPKALRRAQKLLGAETERETVEIALDLVAFRHEVTEGLQSLAGLELDQRD